MFSLWQNYLWIEALGPKLLPIGGFTHPYTHLSFTLHETALAMYCKTSRTQQDSWLGGKMLGDTGCIKLLYNPRVNKDL